MEEVPDMDDLLDEMESDLIKKSRVTHPPPLLPPTSIGMQPRGFLQNPPMTKSIFAVPKFTGAAAGMNEHMEGQIDIDPSKLPNTFQPKNVIGQRNEKEVSLPVEGTSHPPVAIPPEQEESEPEPEEVSEAEEDTIVPETQVMNVTDRDVTSFPPKVEVLKTVETIPETKQLDTEMESMLEYLNGFDDPPTVVEAGRKPGGRDVVAEFAEQLSEELVESALNLEAIRNMHEDPEIEEYYSSESAPDFSENHSQEPEKASAVVEELSNGLPTEDAEDFTAAEEKSPEEDSELQKPPVPVEETLVETPEVIESTPESSEEIKVEVSEAEVEPEVAIESPEPPESPKSEGSESQEENAPVPEEELSPVHEVDEKENEKENEKEEKEEEEEKSETAVPELEIPTVELATETETESAVVEPCEQEEEDPEELESRPRIDSSIATIHMLHESDSEDSLAPRRERRLTESELQLGKTSPYWIPDSECPLCMLCNAKFTIITRRHHCRACGRVLCGSCCSEKAILEYLQEEGKKPQAVRVCKPCSAMLSRIEAHEQGEKLRRESVTSETDVNPDESATTSTALPPAVPPRGVLKTRSMTQGNDEEGASTSTASVVESTRRSVMFRDGVRPGAPADEENPEDERSTALKPKKKSRKRQSVVKRIAELKMEEELHIVLPEESEKKIQVLKPGADFPVYEKPSTVLESLCNFSVVTLMVMKNLSCTVQIFNNPNFGLVWVVSSQGFAQVGLDELLFSWTLDDREKQRVEADEPELDEKVALSYLPLAVLRRIGKIFTLSTEHEFAGVRRVCDRLGRLQSSASPEHPLPTHIMLFRPTVQTGLENMSIPKDPFLVACFLHDDELHWATALPNRLLYKLGEKFNVFPTPFVNPVGRPSLYSTDFTGTVLKVFTDFRHWSYRMRHIPGCTVSLANDKTVIRIPKSAISDLKEVLNFSRSMVAWSCDLNHDDDSVLVCEETDPGLYSTQVFAKYIGQRESTSASFVILDGGSKVNSLQVNVVEDGVAIRLQSERLEVILNAINEGHDVVETSKDMEFRVEFIEDGDWLSSDNEYYPRSRIDGLFLMNKFQYGLSLERVLTQALPVQGLPDYEVRMSHVYNLGEGRLTPEEEPKIYGMVEIAAKECVSMLEPHIRVLIASGITSVSIRLFLSANEVEYDVSKWEGLDEENCKYRQSLDQLIPMLYNMIDYVPNGFEVEFVLSFVTTRTLRN